MSDNKIFSANRLNIPRLNVESSSAEYMEDEIPIVLAANQKYIPILYICLVSLIEHIDKEFQYHIYVFHTDITVESRNKFSQLCRENVWISFINVQRKVEGHALEAKEHITTETFYRFLILDILKAYPKALYLDCDTIICHDVAQLYHMELGDNLIAAVVDADFSGQCGKKDSEMLRYCQDVLKLDNPFSYFQAGVLVINIHEMRKQIHVKELFDMSDTGLYRFSDQDILNIVCRNRVKYLDMAWNVLTDCGHFRQSEVILYAQRHIREAYEVSRLNPYIIHYAGFIKPWMNPKEDFAEKFWLTARRTEYYELLLWDMMEGISAQTFRKETGREGFLLKTARKTLRHVFPKESRARKWAVNVYLKLNRHSDI